MTSIVGQCFWLAAPVAIAGILHMWVVKRNLWPRLAVPIDGGRSYRGAPVFGPNKTWRGVAFMIAGAAALGAVQGIAGGEWAARAGASPIRFDRLVAALGVGPALGHGLGYGVANAVLGLGYVLGELPNSFAKRRLAIHPGRTTRGAVGLAFFVVDQADSVVAALALGAVAFSYAWRVVAVGTLCLSLLHLAINGSLYLVRVRRNL